MVEQVERGEVDPVIDTVYALDEIAEAHRRMAAGAAMGKLVVLTRRAPRSRRAPRPGTYTEDVLERLFAADGPLARAHPAYRERPAQLVMAQGVERVLTRGGTLVCEAGTGTGKSLGYLVPAALSGRRVIVSTATLALQSQLLRDDLPLAAAARGKPIRAELLKGRSNYACRRMVVQLGMRLFDPVHGEALERLRPWLDTTLRGDRAELDHVPPAGAWAEVAVGPERCLGAALHVLVDLLRRGGARPRRSTPRS